MVLEVRHPVKADFTTVFDNLASDKFLVGRVRKNFSVVDCNKQNHSSIALSEVRKRMETVFYETASPVQPIYPDVK